MNTTTANFTIIKICYTLNQKAELIKNFTSETDMVIHIVTLVVCVVLFFSTVILNGVSVATIWTSRTLSEKVCHYSIMIQSIIDLAIGVIIIPIMIGALATEIAKNPSCVVAFIMKNLSGLFILYSMTSLSMVNMERYMGVLYPLFHRVQVTKSRLLKYFLLVCGLQTIIYGVFIRTLRARQLIIGVTVAILLLQTMFVYASILYSGINSACCSAGRNSGGLRNPTDQNRKIRRFKKEWKLAKACFLVVICFIISSLPTADRTFQAFFEVNNIYLHAMRKRWCLFLVTCNSTVNSIIYFWLNKELRQHGKALFRKIATRLRGANSNLGPKHSHLTHFLSSLNPNPNLCRNAKIDPNQNRRPSHNPASNNNVLLRSLHPQRPKQNPKLDQNHNINPKPNHDLDIINHPHHRPLPSSNPNPKIRENLNSNATPHFEVHVNHNTFSSPFPSSNLNSKLDQNHDSNPKSNPNQDINHNPLHSSPPSSNANQKLDQNLYSNLKPNPEVEFNNNTFSSSLSSSNLNPKLDQKSNNDPKPNPDVDINQYHFQSLLPSSDSKPKLDRNLKSNPNPNPDLDINHIHSYSFLIPYSSNPNPRLDQKPNSNPAPNLDLDKSYNPSSLPSFYQNPNASLSQSPHPNHYRTFELAHNEIILRCGHHNSWAAYKVEELPVVSD